MTPTSSVIIRTFGRPETFYAAASSLREGWDTTVVFDGPAPADFSLPEGTKLLQLPEFKGGNGYAAANLGVSQANTDYIVFLDDDDQFVRGAGEVLKEAFTRFQPDMLVPTILHKGLVKVCHSPGLRAGNVAMVIYKREVLLKHPFYFPRGRGLSDWHHVADCVDAGCTIEWIGEVMYIIRPDLEGNSGLANGEHPPDV